MLVSGIGYFDVKSNNLKNMEAYTSKSQPKSNLAEVFGNYNDSFNSAINNNNVLTRIFKSLAANLTSKADNSKQCLDLIS